MVITSDYVSVLVYLVKRVASEMVIIDDFMTSLLFVPLVNA